MTAKRKTTAVVVGRFQVPTLHEGHRSLFEHAFAECDEVLAVLGVPYTTSINDPYDFTLQRIYFEETFRGRPLRVVEADPLPASPELRSKLLDVIIARECKGKRAIVYGGDDSIVHKYVGRYPKRELELVPSPRGTEVRAAIEPKATLHFREGVAYGARIRKPIRNPAVDIAPVRGNFNEVLLISKPEDEGKLRFAGVFFDPDLDQSYEDAAVRGLRKELGLEGSMPVPVGSRRILDPRMKRTKDSIVSTLMRIGIDERPHTIVTEPGVTAHWVPRWFDQVPDDIIDMHRPLAELIKHRWSGC